MSKIPLRLPAYRNEKLTVSLSRIWFIDEMNPGNDYYSSPDQHMGNQKAPKIEKSIGLIWRKLRSKYEIQVFGDMIKMFTFTMSLYEPTF